MLGCAGGDPKSPGKNSKYLATIICATVLAGELSLLAAQCTHDLVRSHMKLNRSAIFKPKKLEQSKSITNMPSREKTSNRLVCDKNPCYTGIL